MQTLRAAWLVGILALVSALGAQQSLPPRIIFQAPPPNPSATRSPTGAVRISGGVMAGQLIRKVWPTAVPCGASGAVVMHAIIGTDGKVEQLTLISGPSDALISAAMNAVRQWEYKPYILNGNPVRVDTTIVSHIDVNSCPTGDR